MSKTTLGFVAIVTTVLALNVANAAISKTTSNRAMDESSTVKNLVPDSVITTEIKGKYIADAEIKALDIKVETINGKVTLSGKVPSQDIHDRAVSIAKSINGVHTVESLLVVAH
jgi:hyperosmotically inducible protein